MKPLLSGIRILGVTQGLAAPYGLMLLADLGAEVINIESPLGDMSRRLPLPQHKGQCSQFLAVNRNKKSMVLDLMTPAGKKAFYDLVKISDVVWDNFRPGARKRLGIDYESLKKVNPRIITGSITGYGSSGPYKDHPAFDAIVSGYSGMLSTTGEPGGPPIKPGPPVGDFVTGAYCALGTAVALAKRAGTGEGQEIEVSMLDTCISLMAIELSYYCCSGIVPQATGSSHRHTYPSGAFKTQDGYVYVTSAWPRIARVINAEWMIDDPRFATPADRVKNKEELQRIVAERFTQATTEQWLEIFKVEDIPGGPVNTIDKVVVDPQVTHNNMIVGVDDGSGGEIRVVGNPIKMKGVEEKFMRPPGLGEHTRQVLREFLGYSEEMIKQVEKEQHDNAGELENHLHHKVA
ncbi:MAG: CoA transferase [Chloroflexi bacterium]|nr:CoA transferase [Chloroflexota bacterium]